MAYQHLLVAVDQTQDGSPLIAKAHQLARQLGAKLSVLSVMLPIPIETMGGDLGMGMLPVTPTLTVDTTLSEQLLDDAMAKLKHLCAPFGIAAADVHLRTDHVDTGIIDTAAQLGADLIVVGHQQRSGFFERLFSHTDQTVVRRATCDVLTIHLESQAS